MQIRAIGLTGVWHSATDGNFVGNLANNLGTVVDNIDVPIPNNGGDIDILTKTNFHIEVKSGKNKMKLPQSHRNMEYAKSQGRQYILYMPNATTAQIREATKQGIPIITNENTLKQTIRN